MIASRKGSSRVATPLLRSIEEDPRLRLRVVYFPVENGYYNQGGYQEYPQQGGYQQYPQGGGYGYEPYHQGGYGYYQHGQRVELRIHGKCLAADGSRLHLDHYEHGNGVWTITHLHDDVVEIKAHNGHFLGCGPDGVAYLHHSHHDGGDTKFHLEHVGGGSVAFRSKHGPYLSVYDNGGWFGHHERGTNSVFTEIILS